MGFNPNFQLDELRRSVLAVEASTDDAEAHHMATSFKLMDEWLKNGGILPRDWVRKVPRPGSTAEVDDGQVNDQLLDEVTGQIYVAHQHLAGLFDYLGRRYKNDLFLRDQVLFAKNNLQAMVSLLDGKS